MTDLIAPGGRPFNRAALPKELADLNAPAFRQRYRGVLMIKNPFDIAIYMSLFSKLKPRSVIEIGSRFGGSALWFADMIRTRSKDGRVLSVDVKPPEAVRDGRVSFLQGDATRLGEVLTPDVLASLPRPWLVSEDSAHTYETTRAVLDFFSDRLEVGEYIVIEDGALGEWLTEPRPEGAPNEAVRDFLASTDGRYEIDAGLCDVFGYNVTANPNGYLRRVK